MQSTPRAEILTGGWLPGVCSHNIFQRRRVKMMLAGRSSVVRFVRPMLRSVLRPVAALDHPNGRRMLLLP
jgi:hypothetical protein